MSNANVFQERFKKLVGDTATQEEIAKKVNTSRQNVGNWLNGKSKPDIYALTEIAKGYGVSTDWLLGLTDVKSNNIKVKNICEYTGITEDNLHFIKNIAAFDNINKSGDKYSYIDTFNMLLEALNYNGRILLALHNLVNTSRKDYRTIEDEIMEKICSYKNNKDFDLISDFSQWIQSEYTFIDGNDKISMLKDNLQNQFSMLLMNIESTFNSDMIIDEYTNMHRNKNNYGNAFNWIVHEAQIYNSKEYKNATIEEQCKIKDNLLKEKLD